MSSLAAGTPCLLDADPETPHRIRVTVGVLILAIVMTPCP